MSEDEYRVEEREDGYLFKYLVLNKNGDELERFEGWVPHGDVPERERQARNVCLLLNQQEREIVSLRNLLRDSAGMHETAAAFTQMSTHPLAGRCTVALRNIKTRIDEALK